MKLRIETNSTEMNKATDLVMGVMGDWNIPAENDFCEAVVIGRKSFETSETRRFPGGSYTCSMKSNEDNTREYTLDIEIASKAIEMILNVAAKAATAIAPAVLAFTAFLASIKPVTKTVKDSVRAAMKEFSDEFIPTKMMTMTEVINKDANVYDLVFIEDDGFGQTRVMGIRHEGAVIPQFTETMVDKMDLSHLQWEPAENYRENHENEIAEASKKLRNLANNTETVEPAEETRTETRLIDKVKKIDLESVKDPAYKVTMVHLTVAGGKRSILVTTRVTDGEIINIENLDGEVRLNIEELKKVLISLDEKILYYDSVSKRHTKEELDTLYIKAMYEMDTVIPDYDRIRRNGIGTIWLKGNISQMVINEQ